MAPRTWRAVPSDTQAVVWNPGVSLCRPMPKVPHGVTAVRPVPTDCPSRGSGSWSPDQTSVITGATPPPKASPRPTLSPPFS